LTVAEAAGDARVKLDESVGGLGAAVAGAAGVPDVEGAATPGSFSGYDDVAVV
jgi:hypothetical protein